MSTDIHTLAGAYVLDSVTDIERAEFDRHLKTCPACNREVAELRETAARLGDLTVPPPPAALRADVLQRIGRTRQVAPGHSDVDRKPGRARWPLWGTAAAAAVLIAAGSGAAGYALQEHRAHSAESRARQANQVLAILHAPDARVTAQSVPVGGHVTVVVSEHLDRGVALIDGLPSPGDWAYQLWIINGATLTSVGLMNATATSTTRIFTGIRDAAAFGISKEPPHGSATPTQPLVASFPLS
ncbi:anti-sigma factor [Rugosimonospora africana]|uniref:Regulator of SigK n=1 Tax=Rugosimonospora africana TaxID=556532 RepID=A0A8J3R5K0_9ACTN|nr:anti-sigma factor [Rugosimonospora africana]GIH20421.1 hypothetical protein Raf01_85930 [Rugosimonospora africana]